jgi:MoaA/NifB/PqqE/SkfB family radical SAM enzyme
VCAPWQGELDQAFERPGRVEAALSAAEVGALLQAQRGADKIALRGGELLLRPEALELLTAARRLAPQVELWSSGGHLARPGVAQALRQAGATAVAIGLWGDSAEGHDYATGVPGSFARAIAGLKAARQAGLRTAVVAPLLRPTYRNLPQLMQKSLALAIDGALLWAPAGPDRTQHPLLAPIASMGPYVDAAARVLAAGQKSFGVIGVAPCSLGSVAAALDLTPTAQPQLGRSKGAPCQSCSWAERCPGQSNPRIQLHGWVGLSPRRDGETTPELAARP